MLNGLRVIEVGQVFAAPYASEILGFLGAEVIKVERPGGDETRHWGVELANGASMPFHVVNRNKLSVALDLKEAADRAHLIDLIGGADVFIHNLKPGSAEKLGLDAATLRQRFPKLIYGEIGAFGDRGPLKSEPAYEMLMQAFAGIMSITGEPDGTPVRAGPSVSDFGAGMWLALGVLAALNRRAETGEGCAVTTSIFEAALNWTLVPACSYLGQGEAPGRFGNGHPDFVPYGLYPTADGGIIIGAGNNRLFAELMAALGQGDLAGDPRFQDNVARLANRDALDEVIGDATKGKSTEDWMTVLRDAGVPCTPMQTIPEAIEHPQTHALGLLQSAPGDMDKRFLGFPVSFDGERPELKSLAPEAGADTDAVLNPED